MSYPRIVPLTFVQNALISFVVHASALPKGKGFSPWVWQILEGSNVIPIVMFEMEEGLDTGKIFVKSQLQLTGYELLAEIRCMLAHEIEKLILTFLQDRDVLPPVPQQGDSTFYRRRTSADSELEINRSIREQFNLLRVVDNDNYPAFFTIDGHTYTLKIEKKND
ncbi:MAG: formyltransferase family protein [Gammaproteobacteria bacterium]